MSVRPRLRPAAPIAGLVLATAWLAACAGGATPSGAPGDETRIAVSVTTEGCAPNAIEAGSGRVVFEVTNAGPDIGEFEILSGTRVVDEVENIIPGFVVNFATHLDGGDYELICYSLQSPRGTLAVTGGVAARPSSAVIDGATLTAYQEAYQAYVRSQAAELITVLEPFVAAVERGDLEAAKAAYAPSRPAWERIEPVAELFSDLDTRMDAREEDFAGGVDDPEFLGWHRLEQGLWDEGTTDGLAPIAAQLRTDAADLATRLGEMAIEPRVIARGAGELIEEVAQSKLTGEEDRYSQADLYSIAANVAGSQQIITILRPTLASLDQAYLDGVD
ncbi:MAG TPA: iron uptake system protein EfeO, partial [Candidatus Saccharimonadales bacterium]|nr:iron uptake system protein EfeO [Candidatus Saccharimonadales bacterium]